MPKPKDLKNSRPQRDGDLREMRAFLLEERRARAEFERRCEARMDGIEKRVAGIEKRVDESAKRREEEAVAPVERREEENAKIEKQRAKKEAAVKKEMAALSRMVANIGRRTGDYPDNGRPSLEKYALARMKRERGVGPVKGRVMGPLRKENEYDGVVVNGRRRRTLVLQIRSKLRLEDVRAFLRHWLPRFAEEFPDLAEGRKVCGALVFEADADNGKAAEFARENGLMLVQVGDRRKGLKVLNPDPAELRPIA